MINEGNILLDMCKSNNLLALNGRCDSDMNAGIYTFRSQSVIDYSIVSSNAMHFSNKFEITYLDSLFSDGHCLLSTTLQFQNVLKNGSKQCKSVRKLKSKLPADKKLSCAQNINLTKVHELTVHLAQLNENAQSVKKENINDLCSNFF